MNTEARNEIIQKNYNYYIWNNHHIEDYKLTEMLYNIGCTKSQAIKQLQIIKNATLRELRK